MSESWFQRHLLTVAIADVVAGSGSVSGYAVGASWRQARTAENPGDVGNGREGNPVSMGCVACPHVETDTCARLFDVGVVMYLQ